MCTRNRHANGRTQKKIAATRPRAAHALKHTHTYRRDTHFDDRNAFDDIRIRTRV